MEELRKQLMFAAKGKMMCKPGYERLCVESMDELVDYYKEMPDWCMERSFPDFRTLKKHFNGYEDKGVFVGKTFHGELLNDLQTYIFHNCKGTIKTGLNLEKGIIPMLYLANGCRLRLVGFGDIKPKKQSVVPIYIFGENEVSAKDNRYVKFTRNKTELI